MLALIDGDIVAWRAATSTDDFNIACARAEESLKNILEKTEATEYRMFLSSPANFRKTIYAEYKAQRPPTPDSVKPVKQWLIDTLNAEMAKEGLEADDEMSINQTENTIICTIDKDLLQVTGRHYQWEIRGKTAKGDEWIKPDLFLTQTDLEGSRLFYEQCLKGDTSDNVKGVAGLGKVKSALLLKDCTSEQEMIQICLQQYSSEEEFLMNAQCLYILRNYDDSYLDRYERLK